MPDSWTHPLMIVAYFYLVLVIALIAFLPLLRHKLRIIHGSLQQQEKIIFSEFKLLREQIREIDHQISDLQQLPEKTLQSLHLAVLKQIQGQVNGLLSMLLKTRSLLLRVFTKSLVNESFKQFKKLRWYRR